MVHVRRGRIVRCKSHGMAKREIIARYWDLFLGVANFQVLFVSDKLIVFKSKIF